MELGLSKRKIEYYEMTLNTVQRCEETMETIVPDYLPDAQQILGTRGTVVVRDKELSQGRAVISGVVELMAVYLTEDGQGAKKLAFAIPFTAVCESKNISADSELVAQTQLLEAEVRLINPRKVLGRAEVAVRFCVYTPAHMEITETVSSKEGIETLTASVDAAPVTVLEEKTFSISDRVELGTGKSAAGEILSHDVSLSPLECKTTAGRCVVKGSLQVDVMYSAAENGAVVSAYFELPFTQVMDAGKTDGDVQCTVTALLNGCSVELEESMDGAGRNINISAYMALQLTGSESITFQVLQDAYSTEGELTAKYASGKMACCTNCFQLRHTCRETLETDTTVMSVCAAWARVGEVTISREGNRATLTAHITAAAIYTCEDGAMKSVCGKITSTVETEISSDAEVCFLLGDVVPGIYALPTVDGIEIRFEVLFTLCVRNTEQITMVENAAVEEKSAFGDMPSIVLRAADGSRLWDLAKQYRSSVETIAAINSLDGDILPSDGRLLLIPKKRV